LIKKLLALKKALANIPIKLIVRITIDSGVANSITLQQQNTAIKK
jgi:hypothetical protein